MTVKFKTRYTASTFPKHLEPGGGERLVETAGYVSAKQRIENLLLAGQRLQAYREAAYDMAGDLIDDEFFDPTRAKNYDMADAFQDQQKAYRGLRNYISKNKKTVQKQEKPMDQPAEMPDDLKKD